MVLCMDLELLLILLNDFDGQLEVSSVVRGIIWHDHVNNELDNNLKSWNNVFGA